MILNKSNKLLILGFAILAASARVQAQEGFYDGDSVDWDSNLYTSLVSYGSDPNCGAPYMESTLNGDYASGDSVYQTVSSATPDVGYSWDYSYNQPFYAGGCQIATVNFSSAAGFAITYTQSVNLYSDPYGNCAQTNACTNGTPKCPISSVKDGFSLVPCDVWHETLSPFIGSTCFPGISTSASGPGACSL